MSKEAKNTVVPELRFPEFKDAVGWKKKILKDVSQMQAGKFVSASEISENKSDELFPCYGGNGLRGYTKSYTHYGRYSLIGRQGALCGNITLADGKFHATEHAVVVTPKEKADTNWLFYMLGYLNLNQYATGQAQPGLSIDNLEKVEIIIPEDETEQQKIASCLSSLDEYLTAQNQKLEALQAHKKGLMQQLFPAEGETVPKLRFEEFRDSGEWVITTIENNCLVKGRIGYRGYTTEDLVVKGQGALVLGGKHVQKQALDLSEPTFLSWEKYYESPEIMVGVGDIIFSQRGTLGDCAIIEKEIGHATINPSMVLLKNITCNAKFLYYILIGNGIQKEVQKNSTSSAVPMLSQQQIKEFPFFIPSPKEQQKIAKCLSSLDEFVSEQTEKIEALKAHKKGLIQGLFPNVNESNTFVANE